MKNINCELVSNQDISYLEGRLKTFLESMGLSEKQEKSAKDMIGIIVWDWFTFIRDHLTDHIIEKRKIYQNKNKSK